MRSGSFRERVPMANAVFVNLKDGRFADGSAGAGEAFARKAVHRGAAFGDVDNDGRLDVVVTRSTAPSSCGATSRRPPPLAARQDRGRPKSNRDGMGAKVKIVTASGAQYSHVNSAVGYGGCVRPRVHFGLGATPWWTS